MESWKSHKVRQRYLRNEYAQKQRSFPVYLHNPGYTDGLAPLDVWYHGTQAEFEQFSHDGDLKRTTEDPISFLGTHFSEHVETANKFAAGLYSDEPSKTGTLFHVKLHIDNPVFYELESDLRDDMAAFAVGAVDQGEGFDILQRLSLKSKKKIAAEFVEHLKSQDYDGIIYGNVVEGLFGEPAAIAFDPEQIEIVSRERHERR